MYRSFVLLLLGVLLNWTAHSQCTGVAIIIVPDGAPGDSITLQSSERKLHQPYLGQQHVQWAGICPGSYNVCLWLGGEQTSCQSADIQMQDTATIVLPAIGATLQPIEIYAGWYLPKRNTVYMRENIAQMGSPLAFQLERLPGMTALQTGGRIAKPTFFGFTGQRLILYKNHIRLEGQQWGLDHGPEINPLYASRIEQVHGADAIALAGDGVGGVIRMTPPEWDDSLHWAMHWRQSYRTNGRQLLQAIDIYHRPQRIKGLGFRISGSDSRAGNLRTPSGLLANTGFKEYAWDGSIHFQRNAWTVQLEHGIYSSTIGIFTGSHSGNLTDLQNRITQGLLPAAEFTRSIGRPNQVIYHETSQANLAYLIGTRHTLQLTMGRQYNERKEFDAHVPLNDSIAALNTPSLHLHLTDYQGQLQWTFQWNNMLKSVLILGLHQQTNTFNGRFYIPNYTRDYRFGAWQLDWKKDKHRIALATRIELLDQVVYRNTGNALLSLNKSYIQPSVGLSWTFNPTSNQRLQVHATSANRPPTINELYSNGLHHGLAVYEMGNENMRQEYAHRLLGEYQISKGHWQFSATGMLQYTQDYMYSAPQKTPILTIRGAFPVAKFEQADARCAGLHAQIDYYFSNALTLSFAHQSMRTVLIADRTTPAFTPADQYRMIIRYPIFKRSKLNCYAEWTSLYTTKQWRVSNAIDIMPPPSAAVVHGLRIHGNWSYRKATMEFGLSIDNLFNTSYRLYTDRMRYYHDALGRNTQVYMHIPLNFYKK